MSKPKLPPPELHALPRVQDRMTFLYLEHCVVHSDNNALTATDAQGIVHLPATSIASILFGPGTSVSHQAMSLIGNSGGTMAWTGESGVRVYASGKSLTRSNRLLRKQAELSTNQRKRLSVAREMYEMRFPGEDVSTLTMNQLRGREGARVRQIYRNESKRTGVTWTKRDYDPNDFSGADQINQALSATNTALYGIVHAAVAGLGLSTGLGFVHEGTEMCFIYDLADLYKAETSIPAAFDACSAEPEDISSAARRMMRDRAFSSRILQRSVRDVQFLFGESQEDEELLADVVTLWDLQSQQIAAGQNHEFQSWSEER